MTGGGADYSVPGQFKAELPAFGDDPTKQQSSQPGELEGDDVAFNRTSQGEELGDQRAPLIRMELEANEVRR